MNPTPGLSPHYRSKTWAAWLALTLGTLGVHRMYLYGLRDRGRIELGFTVDRYGRATDIRVLRADPPAAVDDAAIVQVARSIFRPQIQDGELLPAYRTAGVNFQYDISWLERYSNDRERP